MKTTNRAEPLVSIIVRTKNEERWIRACLSAINRQTYRNFEMILVDNQSTDHTVAKASAFGVKLVKIEAFLPGKALNDGIRQSKGEILVCLSGHCIPVDEHWLANLVRNLDDSEIAGVYGRQQPLSYSSDLNKRDLILTFGLDRKVQIKDSFFHNANSALRREVWDRFPFDELVTNIEDRVWARQIQSAGMKIVYEPEASVYHWHGIHQDLNPERARSIVRILEQTDGIPNQIHKTDISDLHIVAVVPSKGPPQICNGGPLISHTLDHIRSTRSVKTIYVACDHLQTAEIARKAGAVVIARPASLSEEHVDIVDVLQFALEQIEKQKPLPDLVAVLEETFPFRPAGLLDSMIEKIADAGVDSIIAAKREARRLWLSDEGGIRDIGEPGFMPRQLKRTVAYVSLFGLACVTQPRNIREGNVTGSRMAIYEVGDPLAALEIRGKDGLSMGGALLDAWSKRSHS